MPEKGISFHLPKYFKIIIRDKNVSAAGKTQFGLQLSLTVQLPKDIGGASGSACYLTTSSKLPTTRLVEMINVHPLLSPTLCTLSDVQTMQTPSIPLLLHVLSDLLPAHILKHSRPPHKPVKLLVIDALAELFHSNNKTTTKTLVERSRNISDISSLLHTLASRYDIAILVLNEVTDAFNRGYSADTSTDLIYKEQSRWFSRPDSVSGESCKEASLGLVWANQVNVRIMLSRTGRRRYLDEVKSSSGNKARKVGDSTSAESYDELVEESATLIRRLSVVLSSISHPVLLDYIVTTAGISTLQDGSAPRESQQPLAVQPASEQNNPPTNNPSDQRMLLQVSPLDVGCSQDANLNGQLAGDGQLDEWDVYWAQDDVPEGAYNSVDLSSCESNK